LAIKAVLHRSASLIIFVVCRCITVSAAVIEFPFSDHSLIFVQIDIKKINEELELRQTRKLNQGNLASILKEIKSLDFSIFYSIVDINLRWHLFKRVLLNILDTFAPLRRPIPRKHRCVPWYDDELVLNKKHLLSLFKKACTSNEMNDWNNFREARASYQSSFRKKKVDFFADKTSKSFKSSKRFWQFYSSSMKLKNSDLSSRAPKSIEQNNETYTTPTTIAEKFNSFFANLGTDSIVSLDEQLTSLIIISRSLWVTCSVVRSRAPSVSSQCHLL
jgi:hypothetical protein